CRHWHSAELLPRDGRGRTRGEVLRGAGTVPPPSIDRCATRGQVPQHGCLQRAARLAHHARDARAAGRWLLGRHRAPPGKPPAAIGTTPGCTHTTTRRRSSGAISRSMRRASSSDGADTSTHRVGAVTRAQYSAQLAMLWISRQGRGAGSGIAASRRQRGPESARRARERRLHFGDRLLLAIAYPVGGIERTAESETGP